MTDYANIIIPIVVGVIWLAVIVLVIWRSVTFGRHAVYRVHSHEVVVAVSAQTFNLYVDGSLVDRLGGNIRFATLRTSVDGIEFRAVISVRLSGPAIEAAYNGAALVPEFVGKKYRG